MSDGRPYGPHRQLLPDARFDELDECGIGGRHAFDEHPHLGHPFARERFGRPLPEVDIIGLLFGAPTDVSNAELRALSASGAEAAEQALLKAAGARLLAGSISAPVRRVVEETLKLDTAQIAPTIGSDNDPLSTSIRLILGKRLSPRAYLTFSRPLGGATRDQIIVLEYDQTDRLGFVLTQTGDRTFAVDFRVRRSF